MTIKNLTQLGWTYTDTTEAWHEGWKLVRKVHHDANNNATSLVEGVYIASLRFPNLTNEDMHNLVIYKAEKGSRRHIRALQIVFETSGDLGKYLP